MNIYIYIYIYTSWIEMNDIYNMMYGETKRGNRIDKNIYIVLLDVQMHR